MRHVYHFLLISGGLRTETGVVSFKPAENDVKKGACGGRRVGLTLPSLRQHRKSCRCRREPLP